MNCLDLVKNGPALNKNAVIHSNFVLPLNIKHIAIDLCSLIQISDSHLLRGTTDPSLPIFLTRQLPSQCFGAKEENPLLRAASGAGQKNCKPCGLSCALKIAKINL